MDDLRGAKTAELEVSVVGFCRGAYPITHVPHGGLTSNGEKFIDAAFTAHTSEINVP